MGNNTHAQIRSCSYAKGVNDWARWKIQPGEDLHFNVHLAIDRIMMEFPVKPIRNEKRDSELSMVDSPR